MDISMITFQEEKLKDFLEELKPLLYDHWSEIAQDKEQVPLDPDYQKYFELEKQGILHTVTVRDGDTLIGYCLSFIVPHIHYKSTIMAMNDILYVKPSYRKGSIGIRLIKIVEEKLKERGVFKTIYHIKTNHDVGKLFEKLGYTFFEKMYGKVLRGVV